MAGFFMRKPTAIVFVFQRDIKKTEHVEFSLWSISIKVM